MRIKILKIFCAFSILYLSGTTLLSQEQSKEDKGRPDLKIAADNTHYGNAAQFYKLKEHKKALELFTEYLEIYANGLHRKEAYKNIAAIHFEQFDYIKAINSYKLLYEEFSNSEEGIEAFFLTGICYQKMGFLDNAKQVFKSLIEEHPESNFAHQSKIKLDLIEILEKG